MSEVKLQYSLVCKRNKDLLMTGIIYGFTPGKVSEFYISNHWVWDADEKKGQAERREDCTRRRVSTEESIEDNYFQVTEINCGNRVVAFSRSGFFQVKESHTHHNRFRDLIFMEGDYRIRITLFNRQGEKVSKGSLDYPLLVRR